MNRPVTFKERLQLRCLGGGRLIDRGSADLTPRTRKARAMLAYLILTGRTCSRDKLADLLWSDRGAEQAKASVRQALYELRHRPGCGALIITQRDEVSTDPRLVITDLAAIRQAAAEDEYEWLEALLASADGGLLTDLDDLDAEYDDWLRNERAREPAATLTVVTAAAERCFAAGATATARRLVDQVQRLDPANEVAARLAMRIDHAGGNSAALHRGFQLFRDRLKEEYDAAPAEETLTLYRELGIGQPRQPAAPSSTPERDEPVRPATRRGPLLLAGGVGVLALGLLAAAYDQFRPEPAPSPIAAPLLAVLPFDHQSGVSEALADGLWDDTRLALSQAGAVRVVGRSTSLSLDGDEASPADLKRRLGVDYVLAGSVRGGGERVRIVVSLTRTTDGLSIWERAFDGRPGDPIALQMAVAQGIEGRIRGRLAAGGGVRAHQIRTSPAVYALYSEARALIRRRGSTQIQQAADKLRQAVAIDPNYAPAWASLASTARINRHSPEGTARERSEAAANARRAIDLAPNLAHGYAALALVEGEQLVSSERHLKRAVVLDPGNAEAWNWLGNGYAKRGMRAKATAAYERSLAVDPFFWSPMSNLISADLSVGKVAAAEARVAGLERAGAGLRQRVLARATVLTGKGDYSGSTKLLLAHQGQGWSLEPNYKGPLGDAFLRMGYIDENARLWSSPPWYAAVLRGDALPPQSIGGTTVGPRDFWLVPFYGSYASRAMLRQRRPDLVVRQYQNGFRSLNDFEQTLKAEDTFAHAPVNLAVAMRQLGENAEADAILVRVEQHVRARLSAETGDRARLWEMARVRAQQGARGEALGLLSRARQLGWMPDGARDPIDIAADPALAPMLKDPRFVATRNGILAHIARERRELGPVRL